MHSNNTINNAEWLNQSVDFIIRPTAQGVHAPQNFNS